MADIIETDWELNPAELVSGFESDTYLVEPRSPGCHQSDIIRDIENIVIKPGQRRPDIEVTREELDTLNRYRELGFLWETVLEAAFKRRRVSGLDSAKFLKQVEVEHDGVFKTVDGIHIPDWRLLEYKLTFRSKNRASLDRFESEFWGWFAQLKGNCLAHQTRIASLFVMWVCGDYHPPVPVTRRYNIVFQDQDLIDNWTMLLNHKKVMEADGRAPWLKPKSGSRSR
jgi:hypothetical protein